MMVSKELQEFLRDGAVQFDIENNNFVDVYRKAEEYFEYGLEKKHIGELTTVFYEAGIDPLDYMNRIPARFFFDTNIKSFEIPQHITDMGREAFAGCSDLESVTIPSSIRSINYYMFSRCSSLKSITIPNGVTEIGDWAFQRCSSLESAVISNSVKRIGYHTFHECDNFKEITYRGTVAQWRRVKKAEAFNFDITVHCSDGDLQLRNREWTRL